MVSEGGDEGLSPRFDWMQATVRVDPVEAWETLLRRIGDELVPGRGMLGYHRSVAVSRGGETLARVLYGGPNGAPHVIATGAASDTVVPVVRDEWPEHEVSRMDSAQDFDREGGYDLLRDEMLALAARSGISTRQIESDVRGVVSRTLYLGAPSSRVRVRLYEKGRFERQQGNAGASEHWFRLEAQIRPTGQRARSLAASVSAAEAWGMSRWTRDLAASAMGLDVEPISMQLHREADYLRAVRHLVRQYGPTIARGIEVEGSLDAFLARLVLEGLEI